MNFSNPILNTVVYIYYTLNTAVLQPRGDERFHLYSTPRFCNLVEMNVFHPVLNTAVLQPRGDERFSPCTQYRGVETSWRWTFFTLYSIPRWCNLVEMYVFHPVLNTAVLQPRGDERFSPCTQYRGFATSWRWTFFTLYSIPRFCNLVEMNVFHPVLNTAVLQPRGDELFFTLYSILLCCNLVEINYFTLYSLLCNGLCAPAWRNIT